MMLFPLLIIVVVIALAVVFADRTATDDRGGSAARRVLDERLATGEITPDEHAKRAEVLGVAQRRSRTPWSPALVIGGVALLVLVVMGFTWRGGSDWWGGGSGWWWGDHNRIMSEHMGWRTSSGNASAPVAGAETIEVTSTEMRFEPTVFAVTAGEPVNVTLVNDGEVFHDLTIPDLGFVLGADSGERASGSLTVDRAGTYDFYCSVPGHAAGGMRGTLQVRVGGGA